MSTSTWHTIRPWAPPLTLSVREITSVSVTFILSTAPAGETDSLMACLGVDPDDSDNDHDNNNNNDDDNNNNNKMTKPSVVAGALAGGLSVDVDRSAWRRVFIRIDDKADEAVIIIYGLMPGRQYDVDLELVQGGQKNRLERRVVTAEDTAEIQPDSPPATSSTDLPSPPSPSSSSSPSSNTHPHTHSSSNNSHSHSHSHSHPHAHTHAHPHPSPGFTPLTLEDRLHHLTHTLTAMSAERDALTTTLKSARRDAQKADAALRSEIDLLRRAADKHASIEHRSKQKVLALQEAVKRAALSAQATHAEAAGIEEALPDLVGRREDREGELRRVEGEAGRVAGRREAAVREEQRRVEGMGAELAGMGVRLERLQGKRERMEAGTIPELEEQLRRVEREIEAEMAAGFLQRGVGGVGGIGSQAQGAGSMSGVASMSTQSGMQPGSGIPSSQSTHQVASPASWGPWNSPPRHAQRSSSLHHHKTPSPVVLLQNPHRQASLKAQGAAKGASATPTGTGTGTGMGMGSSTPPGMNGTGGSGTTPTTPGTTSSGNGNGGSGGGGTTLSSRAAPFEPGKPIRSHMWNSHAHT